MPILRYAVILRPIHRISALPLHAAVPHPKVGGPP